MKRHRRRLSRTVSPARWREYRRFLQGALGAGYELVALEDWVDRGYPRGGRLLILRHDVDQHPVSALRMLEVEGDLGARATWYFRWRTAQPGVVATVREHGAGVGLHYETLSRTVLARGATEDTDPAELTDSCREVLREELRAFAAAFGPVRSACPHGDSRAPHVRNGDLLRGQDLKSFGIEFDGNEAMHGRRLGLWLTDRSRAEGRWGDGVRPAEAFEQGISPILCVVHPNNWASGASLWGDRILSAVLATPGFGRLRRGRWPIATAGDDPPIDHS